MGRCRWWSTLCLMAVGLLVCDGVISACCAASVPWGPQQVVSTAADGAVSVIAADIDGDGDLDLVSASLLDDKIAWYENVDGAGSFGPQQVVSSEAGGAQSVIAADMDGDGDLDLASPSAGVFFGNNGMKDGCGVYYGNNATCAGCDGVPYSGKVADVCGVCGGDGSGCRGCNFIPIPLGGVWFDGCGVCGGPAGISTCGTPCIASSSAVYDCFGVCNGTAYIDECGMCVEGMTPNTFGAFKDSCGDCFGGDTWRDSCGDCHGSNSRRDDCGICGGNNSHMDSCGVCFGGERSNDNKIVWFENTDGAGFFGPQQVVSCVVDGAQSVIAADIDGDGDLDLASASLLDDKIAWYENTDGAGTFGPQQVVSTAADGAQSVIAADMDGDGDLDLASASQWDNKIAWYENTDGAGSFGPQQVVSTAADGAYSVIAADIDGDGDLDLASASRDDDKIAWYQSSLFAPSSAPKRRSFFEVQANAASSLSFTGYFLIGVFACLAIATIYKRERSSGKVHTGYVGASLLTMLLREHSILGIIFAYPSDPFSRLPRIIALVLQLNVMYATSVAVLIMSKDEEGSIMGYILSGIVSSLMSLLIGLTLFKSTVRSRSARVAALGRLGGMIAACGVTALNIIIILGNELFFPPTLVDYHQTVLVAFSSSLLWSFGAVEPLAIVIKKYLWLEAYVYEPSHDGLSTVAPEDEKGSVVATALDLFRSSSSLSASSSSSRDRGLAGLDLVHEPTDATSVTFLAEQAADNLELTPSSEGEE